MNRRLLSYTIILTSVLAIAHSSPADGISNSNRQWHQSTTSHSGFQRSVSQYADSSVAQYQTKLTINANKLNRSHRLTINGTNMSGTIRLNGSKLRTLEGTGTAVNLAPYLSRGRHTVTVSGVAQGNIQMTFTAPGINVIHQSSGSRWMNLELILDVR